MTTIEENKLTINDLRPMIVDQSYADSDINGNLNRVVIQDFQEAKDLFLMLKNHRPEIWNQMKEKMGFENDDSIA